MMNKNKSAKLHLLRFLFLLPVLAVILVSFRKEIGDTLIGKQKHFTLIPVAANDTVPEVTMPNSKGYIINVKDKKGECLLVIKDKTGKEVKRLLLTEWNAHAEKYEGMYGEIPPPPPPAAPIAPEIAIAPVLPLAPQHADVPIPPAPPVPTQLPENIKKININNDKVTVTLKNGQKENYDLNNVEQKAKFESKYGEFVSPPPPPPAKDNKAPAVNIQLKEKVENADASLQGPGNPSAVSGSYVKGVPDNVLYILDGIEIKKSQLDRLEPGKIESINVLKGNSAVTLYGEKGSNGVIIIKTKANEKAKPVTQTPFLFPVVKNDGC